VRGVSQPRPRPPRPARPPPGGRRGDPTAPRPVPSRSSPTRRVERYGAHPPAAARTLRAGRPDRTGPGDRPARASVRPSP
jgi:hypothetical protein